ncbi:Uncharacterized protein FWK35_00023611 [Aphis craccivora]|uniref:Pre-C2HC domain-containing protein n=1 Tax=Aphis craccivora TaxID=307492 RepID=A0A6G0Z203_APHCR|nr:Uncharacterized protein FWK35_00023611 [Aphis craccivora]
MNNINNKANQLIGKHKTTTSSQPNNSIPHASNSEYDGATSNKNSNDNFTLVTKQVLNQLDEPDLNSSSQQLPFEQNNDISDEVFKPPPLIFVRGVVNYLDLCTALIELIGVDNFFCKTSADQQEAEFHTYQLKQDKPLRVVIRNLHLTTNVDTIKEELEVRLFEIRRVTNVLHKLSKIPLPLFFVDLINQDYGHTKTYCGYPSCCVRCGSNHKSPDCPNQRSDPPKCALCSGNHPASYKGCSIYKDLQRAKKSYTKSNFVPTNTRFNTTTIRDSYPINDTHPIQPDPHSPTYAQATSGRPANNSTPSSTLHSSQLLIYKSLTKPVWTYGIQL